MSVKRLVQIKWVYEMICTFQASYVHRLVLWLYYTNSICDYFGWRLKVLVTKFRASHVFKAQIYIYFKNICIRDIL